MLSGINMLCFSASYAIALGLEIFGLWNRIQLRRVALLTMASAGVFAHTWYLGVRVAETPDAPLASHRDWYILAAWALAVIYLAAKFYYRKSSMGLFLLPTVLGLIGASRFASTVPLATFQAPRVWGQIHGLFLMLGTVAVLLGFVAGLMYLIQSNRLKRKLGGGDRLRLPSLEWLERANSRSLGAAAFFVAGGFFTGILSLLARTGDQNFVPWTDPVVLALGAMLLWLLVAEGFRLVYPAARRGRKVAYLTVAAFVFMLLALGAVKLEDSLHMAPTDDLSVEAEVAL
ncbi:MAG: hypothetical protein AAGD11_05190 [Planctomycetota bacterium]